MLVSLMADVRLPNALTLFNFFWGQNEKFLKIPSDTFRGNMDSCVVAKFGENRPLESC